MSRQRRTFTPAFKRDAASLVLDQGHSCPEQQTIQELQALINRLELEKKILKEATALLMAEEHGRRR